MKRKFKDGEYNHHLKKIKQKAVKDFIKQEPFRNIDNIKITGFRQCLERKSFCKGILIGAAIVLTFWLLSL